MVYVAVFILVLEGIIVNCIWWGKMSQSSWRSVCVWRSGACQPSIEHQKGKVIDQLLLCINLFNP